LKTDKTIIPVRDMAIIAMFTAMISAAAPFSIMLGPIPLTFATLMIYLTVGVLGWKYGVLSVTLYILLGIIGLPVFSNFEGGFHKIAGVTGGYIVGYIPCAIATGLITETFRKKLRAYVCGMVVGTILLYACGTVWFILQTGNSLIVSLTLCVTPFLIGDTIKIVFAGLTAPRLLRLILDYRSQPS
jgi:biotin transport system substrate-specific component